MNYEDEARNFQRALLDEAFLKVIHQNEEQQKVWAAYKNGHLKVAEALSAFQKDLSVSCMVPIGKRAFMKGKLIHTNEVLACLGDGYFAKYSAAGAAALCERRVRRAEEKLKQLNAERDLYETRMTVIDSDAFEDCAGSEIVEHWNEEQIDEWKTKHRERERKYHQKLAERKQEEKRKIETEEDLFHRLDQLEIEEELADEFNRLEDERYELFGEELEEGEYYETESSSESGREDSKVEEKSTVESEEIVEPKRKIKRSVSFVEPELSETKGGDPPEEKEACSEDAEGSEEDIQRIEFRHSGTNSVAESGDSIATPADIYRIFSKPKSILKRSPNDIPAGQAALADYETEEEEEEEQIIKPSAYETVVKDIKERSTATLTNTASKPDYESRPVSKFKKHRQSKQHLPAES
ncbi:unconventional prefoldin RPB5 interactor [Andrena cerasifolii]|uniref:unconventional prefoldin RPB5 interactor n=1 Tax=Andrena cerasifolii TaxID=2819439 RepID=UPI004037FAA3